jgi:hypothetical protein
MDCITRQEILAQWPEAEAPPRADSLRRSVKHGCEQRILVRRGAGTKAEAFRSRRYSRSQYSASGSARVVWRGSWNYHARRRRSADRNRGEPDDRANDLGLARSSIKHDRVRSRRELPDCREGGSERSPG